jgi:UDP-glucose 4-epimerase
MIQQWSDVAHQLDTQTMTHTSSRRFLITGGAGFIGSHLADLLLEQGHRVTAIDDLSTGRVSNIEHLLNHERFTFTQGSITDPTLLEPLARDADIIVHLAAAVGVKLIVEQPVRTIETNIMGTEVVLKAARENRCRVLIASTSEVYGKGSKIPFAEEDDILLGPTSKSRWAYAASKMVDEFLGLAYWRQYGLPVVLFRLFNTVGPRQTGRYGMAIPRFVRQALAGEPLTVYGHGSQQRCFCDARDAVRAIAALAVHEQSPGQVYNVGGRQEITMASLAQRIIKLAGSRSTITFIPYSQAYAPGFEDMQRRVPDTTRLQALIDWSPRWSLDQILLAVIEDQSRHASS